VGLISPPRNELAILPAGVVPGTRGALAIRTNNNKRSLYSARDRIRPAYPVAFEDRPHSAFVNVITPNIRLIASKSSYQGRTDRRALPNQCGAQTTFPSDRMAFIDYFASRG
jgi:hypothetical protein